MNGHELQAIFDTWSVHSKEHGEVITQENVSGFVQEVKKALASAPAQPMYVSESDLERLLDPRISGKGCFISKEPRDGFVLIVPTSSMASKEEPNDAKG